VLEAASFQLRVCSVLLRSGACSFYLRSKIKASLATDKSSGDADVAVRCSLLGCPICKPYHTWLKRAVPSLIRLACVRAHTSGFAIFKTALNVVRNAKVILDI
jgi:hypothetical protein